MGCSKFGYCSSPRYCSSMSAADPHVLGHHSSLCPWIPLISKSSGSAPCPQVEFIPKSLGSYRHPLLPFIPMPCGSGYPHSEEEPFHFGTHWPRGSGSGVAPLLAPEGAAELRCAAATTPLALCPVRSTAATPLAHEPPPNGPINFSSGIKPDKTQPCRRAGLPTPDLEVRAGTRGVGCGDGGRARRGAVRGSVRDRRGLCGAGMRRGGGGGRAGGGGARLAAAGAVVGTEAGGSARAAGPAGRRLPAPPQGLPRAPAPPERPSPAPATRPRRPAGWAAGREGRGDGAAAATQLWEGEASAQLRGGAALPQPPCSGWGWGRLGVRLSSHVREGCSDPCSAGIPGRGAGRDAGQNGLLDVMRHWPQWDAGCDGMLRVGGSQEGCDAGHWGPQEVQDSRKVSSAGDTPFAIRWVQQLEDTRLTSHPHRDQQPRSCCSPPCCGLDKKRAELPRALLQWLPHAGSESWVSRMSREPAQTKVAARDNVCIGGSWLWDITSCMMTSLRYNDVKGCLHLSLHPDHNVISTTPRAQPARAIIPQGWEQEAGAAGAYSSHNPQHLYRAFHFSSRQTKESNLHCLLIKRWHPLAPCSLFSWGSWDWGEAFFVFFRGQAAQKSVQSPKEREAVKKNLFTQISTGPMWAL